MNPKCCRDSEPLLGCTSTQIQRVRIIFGIFFETSIPLDHTLLKHFVAIVFYTFAKVPLPQGTTPLMVTAALGAVELLPRLLEELAAEPRAARHRRRIIHRPPLAIGTTSIRAREPEYSFAFFPKFFQFVLEC